MILRLLILLLLPALATAADNKPNVIIVLADDMGIGDMTPSNPDCKIRTPHLQKMADEGILFMDAHSTSAVCTPTRYGLLTGRYNWRSVKGRGVLSGTSPHLIPATRPTIAHMLRKAGYTTQMIGKWHLGWDWHKDGKKIDFTKPVKKRTGHQWLRRLLRSLRLPRHAALRASCRTYLQALSASRWP